ncbi:PqqD family protein [Eubacterium aggregans]|uniref:PqqD family protein n=1 Tax=Eubacterium aggregans TaxID=81409 RepID=UPI003F341EAF
MELEMMGSYVWEKIDGESSIYRIGQNLFEVFGDESLPLYERLAHYINDLYRHGLIVYVY